MIHAVLCNDSLDLASNIYTHVCQVVQSHLYLCQVVQSHLYARQVVQSTLFKCQVVQSLREVDGGAGDLRLQLFDGCTHMFGSVADRTWDRPFFEGGCVRVWSCEKKSR